MHHAWSNCTNEPDPEMVAIDAIAEGIAPLDEEALRIRRLITMLETCHHKAERHVELIIEAIAVGRTGKGPNPERIAAEKLPAGSQPPAVQAWHDCRDILAAWCRGSTEEVKDRHVAGTPARTLADWLGERTPLKVWQVERLAEKIGRYLDASVMWNTGDVIGAEGAGEDKEFRDLTERAVIHDTVDGRPAEITLAAAIDHFRCCDWNFANNLEIVLRAIGGDLHPDKPFAACARNIKLTPIRERMRVVSNTLTAFSDGTDPGTIDRDLLAALGEKTPVKHWLAACLGKTIRSQLGLRGG